MTNWPIDLPESFSRFVKPRMPHAKSTLEDLRRYYGEMTRRFAPAPEGVAVERAVLGQIRGEWVYSGDANPQRIILYFHGGGYISGSPETHRPLVSRLCKASGAAALSLEYRLGPEFPYPAALRDAVDAYRMLLNKDVPAHSIVLAGDGSGGGLAFATLLAIRNGGFPMPAACIAMSPWADLTLTGWSILENARKDTMLNWELLFLTARHYMQKGIPADIYASPVFANFRDLPPIMVHAGSQEILRDDASRIGDLAAAANIPVSVEIYDGMQHLFQAFGDASSATVSLNRLGQFIRARTQPSANASLRPAVAGARRD
jgi:monoterpene epsilon-lactone hydrolase